ncbi:glutathione S-transferase [Sphingomonas spermidinifaciens]|uniref:Glutathione S-transferase n=1 Tax=Sphingomonas spermidinifaciens TaxID=1141889 RepID=A0A2A4B0Q4_9SPHN|nr:glutathione S-transferase N-terminal domain-containing protein [Sphingomonas spermidinifaciens]PCD01650.1 glutathione S-transferase [Sphingomonas spermidinifaciens]
MRLYDSPWAPSPRRVRIFAAEKGIALELVEVDLPGGEHLREPFLKCNPRGAVPVLETDDGACLTEGPAICRYLEALQPDPPLFGASPIEVGRIEQWTRRIEGEGYAAGVYAFRNSARSLAGRALVGAAPSVPQIPELVERARIMWTAFVADLDAHLTDREWIATDAYSFADITALVTLDFCGRAKLAVPEDAVNLRRWHAAAGARPSAAA